MAKAPAKAKTTAVDLMGDMEADAHIYQHTPQQDMLLIPRVKILQDLSPEVKPEHAKYVEGARPGMIFNEVNGSFTASMVFTPFDFTVRYIAWRPRKQGGGLVDPNLTLQECEENFEANGIGSWTGLMRPTPEEDPIRVEVHQTPEFLGVAKTELWGPMPIALSMPSTKVKTAKKINTAITLTEVPGKNGPFIPPMFYHQFVFHTAIENSGDDSWYGFVTNHLGVGGIPGANPEIDVDMLMRAREQRRRYDAGEIKVDDSSLER